MKRQYKQHPMRVRSPPFYILTRLCTQSQSSLQQPITTFEKIFDIQVPEGQCVGIRLPNLPEEHPDSLHPVNILRINNSTESSLFRDRSLYHPQYSPTIAKMMQQQPPPFTSSHWLYQYLHLDEIQYGLTLRGAAQTSFYMGRMALREALVSSTRHAIDTSGSTITTRTSSAVTNASILKDEHGRPQLPDGWLGSISHKRQVGVALAVHSNVNTNMHCTTKFVLRKGVGVDIEETTPKTHINIARKVLTINEQHQLGRQLLPVRNQTRLLLYGDNCFFSLTYIYYCYYFFHGDPSDFFFFLCVYVCVIGLFQSV